MTSGSGSSDSTHNAASRNRRERKALRRQERDHHDRHEHDHQDETPASVAVGHSESADRATESPDSLVAVLDNLQLQDLAEAGTQAFNASPGHTPDAPSVDAAQLAELTAENEALKTEILGKEDLITALTDRLEQAAEQLDRLRRSGADRGWRGGGGLPADVIQDQRAAVEELKQIAARFDEMQAATTLGRLEMQVTELRDLIVTLQQNPQHRPEAASPQRTPVFSGPAGAAAFTAPAPSGSWWDRQKAAMLGDDPPEESSRDGGSPADDPSAAGDDGSGSETADQRMVPDFSQFVFEIPSLPPEPHWDELTLEHACALLRERDALLIQLREPLVQAQMANLFAQGFGSIAALPDDLRTELSDLEDQWEARFRKHETELSIERARLAREQMQARQLQEQLRKQVDDTGATTSRSGDGETRAERRWFRFMGQQDRSADRNS